jgi:acyl-CoA hydrolase
MIILQLRIPCELHHDPNIIGQIDNFVSINNAIQVDLLSQVNAESNMANGIPSQVSGNGGMTDFITGAINPPMARVLSVLLQHIQRGTEQLFQG